MTGFEIAGGFATIVALIGQFKQEEKDIKDAKKEEHQRFIEWLEYHRHHEIKNAIEKNAAIQEEVGRVLQQDTQLILSKINEISAELSKIASTIDFFQGLAGAISAQTHVHAETMELLPQLVKNDWKKFLLIGAIGSNVFISAVEGACSEINIDEQFLQQDLDDLVNLGYLRLEYTDGGDKMYSLTRTAYKAVEAGKW